MENQIKQKKTPPQKLIIQTQNATRGVTKNLFYVVLSLSVTTVLMIIAILMLTIFNKPHDRYFALDNNLRVIQLVPTNQPILTNEKIVRWSNETIVKINTLSFTNWRSQLQSYSSSFTNKAFEDFIQQLRDTGNLGLIRKKRLNTIIMLTSTSRIIKKGISPKTGAYTWVVEAPIIINYEGSKGVEATQRLIATITITRVSTLETPVGIKINNYVTALKGGD